MRPYLPFFIAFAVLWVVQLYATAKQSQHFMREVSRLRQYGETAIGASSHDRLRRRCYVAIASDDTDLVTAAVELRGLTVFARARPVPEMVGRPLAQLAAAPDGDRRSNAVRMAARALLGEQPDRASAQYGDAASPTRDGDRGVATRSSAHLPSSAGARGASERREGPAPA